MKKLFLFLVLIFIGITLYAGDYRLENKTMSVTFRSTDKSVYLVSVSDKTSNTEFIKDVQITEGLWDLSVKKAGDLGGAEIRLYPKNAESLDVSEKKDKLVFTWHNVREAEMTDGFDVVSTVSINSEGVYFDIDVSPSKDYGLWYVSYPKINDLEVRNGTEYMYPFRGQGYLIKEFTEKGFRNPQKRNEDYVKELGYRSPLYLQFGFLTKGDTSLYMSSEDADFCAKLTFGQLYVPYHLVHGNRTYPAGMGEGNKGFRQPYSYHIKTVKGDWYDVCKYYRKVCINKNFPAFTQGKIINRKDIPDWLKNNVYWMRWYNHIGNKGFENVLSTAEYVGIKPALHSYSWSTHFEFDTEYPNFYPATEKYRHDFEILQKKGFRIMPYTNSHLVDMGLSETAKKMGTDLLSMDNNGNFYPEPFFPEKGTDFKMCCISSPYYKVYYDEMIKCIKECAFDALYSDQIGAAMQVVCFNKNHTHPLGGGDHYVKAYNNLIADLRKGLTEIKGEPVPIATEDSAEAFDFDLWIRCSDSLAENMETPMIETVFSQYKLYYGDHLYDDWESKLKGFSEYKSDKGNMTALHKVAVSLVNGIQVGWCAGAAGELTKHPEFAAEYKKILKARVAGLNYFNHGELMRKVNFTNEIPKAHLIWNHFSGYCETDSPVVKTGSFAYGGKTMLCFVNVSKESVPVKWEADPTDLGLKSKKLYTFSEFYPKKKAMAKTNKLKGEFTLLPYETKLITVY